MPIDLVIEDREGMNKAEGSPPGLGSENHSDSRGPPEQVRTNKTLFFPFFFFF